MPGFDIVPEFHSVAHRNAGNFIDLGCSSQCTDPGSDVFACTGALRIRREYRTRRNGNTETAFVGVECIDARPRRGRTADELPTTPGSGSACEPRRVKSRLLPFLLERALNRQFERRADSRVIAGRPRLVPAGRRYTSTPAEGGYSLDRGSAQTQNLWYGDSPRFRQLSRIGVAGTQIMIGIGMFRVAPA